MFDRAPISATAHRMNDQQGDPLIVRRALDAHFGASLLVSYHSRQVRSGD